MHEQYGETALVCASRGIMDCVRLLLDAGADKNSKTVVRFSLGLVEWRRPCYCILIVVLKHKLCAEI